MQLFSYSFEEPSLSFDTSFPCTKKMRQSSSPSFLSLYWLPVGLDQNHLKTKKSTSWDAELSSRTDLESRLMNVNLATTFEDDKDHRGILGVLVGLLRARRKQQETGCNELSFRIRFPKLEAVIRYFLEVDHDWRDDKIYKVLDVTIMRNPTYSSLLLGRSRDWAPEFEVGRHCVHRLRSWLSWQGLFRMNPS